MEVNMEVEVKQCVDVKTTYVKVLTSNFDVYVKTKKAMSAELRIAGASNEIFSPNIRQSLF